LPRDPPSVKIVQMSLMASIILELQLLILETSQRVGKVAIAHGEKIVGERTLDEQRRHARDLTPAIHELLRAQNWTARDLDGVIVSRGPGSYTGLRVGVMSAKMLTYATGCALLAIDTFEAIACGFAPVADAQPRPSILDVIADAQQGRVYAQRFGTHPEPLAIVPFEEWLKSAVACRAVVTGPGLEIYASHLPAGLNLLPSEMWFPGVENLLKLGLSRFGKKERDDPFLVEPLYLRASSAEEKWAKLHPS
jgi:tRNA threonylcarbamoyladenosine biosynthesis protein TsaB